LNDFAKLVEQHQAMVFRTLARLTGQREGVEDMAQEVFLRLFRALPQFRGEASVSTFLYRIVVNVVNDEFRSREKARLTVSIEDHELTSLWADPEHALERDQLQRAVDDALLHMSAPDRTILILHYQEERSYEEIASILGLPMGTVKTHLYRARQRLKAMMGEWIPCGIN
jgi:RNA polymerase sigma factor (sigma-70 family)